MTNLTKWKKLTHVPGFPTSANLRLARCLLLKAFRRPCPKNCFSSYIWHKSFIQTVKCSFFNQRNVYQSSYHTLPTFSYFLLQKFGVSARVGKSLNCEMFIKRFKDLVKKIISPVLFDTNCSFKWLNTLSLTKELFIKFFTVHRSHLVIFIFLHGKGFGTRFQSRKNILVVFAPWRDCWSVYPLFYLTKISKFLI